MDVGLVEGFAVVGAFVGSPLGFKVVGFDVGVVLGDASSKCPPLPEEITIDPHKAVSPKPPSIVTPPPLPNTPYAPALFVKIDMLPKLVAVPEPEELTIDPPKAVSPAGRFIDFNTDYTQPQ